MAQARHGIRLAEPLNHWLRKAYDSGMGLSTAELMLLEECMVAMESVATHLDERTGYFVDHEALLARIARAERGLERRIATARSTRSRTRWRTRPLLRPMFRHRRRRQR